MVTILGLPVTAVHATVIPYSNNFSGSGANVAFTNETADANWTVSGGAYTNSLTTGSSAVASSASLQITNAASSSFTMAVDFTVSAANASSSSTYGFGLFGLNSTFSGASSSLAYYLADVTFGSASQIRIVKVQTSPANVTLASQTGTAYKLTLGSTYSLKLDVVASSGSVSMTFGLYDSTGTLMGSSITGTDSSSPLSGEYFGLRDRYTGTNTLHTVSYDNFSITAVPEPSTYALIGSALIGSAAFGVRRRQRKRTS